MAEVVVSFLCLLLEESSYQRIDRQTAREGDEGEQRAAVLADEIMTESWMSYSRIDRKKKRRLVLKYST